MSESESELLLFFEKPGCINNTKQKKLLKENGFRLECRNILDWPWTAEALKEIFGERPVSEWFNGSAPKIKSGEIDPKAISERSALSLMCGDPLLIRRPIILRRERSYVGFDRKTMAELNIVEGRNDRSKDNLESCPREGSVYRGKEKCQLT